MREAFVRSMARAGNGSVIFLAPKESDVVVPVIVRKLEEESILIGMSSLPPTRPVTHDLFTTLMRKCACTLTRIEMYDYKDEIFYARLILKINKRKTHVMNARPSDAIAIATRVKAPIYIDEKVIRDTAISTSVMHREEQGTRAELEIERNETRVDRLEHALQKAVEVENYEEAARIRDRIQRLR